MVHRKSSLTRPPSLSQRTTQALRVIGLTMFLIMVRLWNLAIFQHEEKLELSRRPQRKVVVERADRGTIRDRFNLPLAVNKVQYNASVLYSEIQKVPRVLWKLDDEGNRVRVYQRKEYIEKLSRLLARELSMEASEIEDLIYSRAALFRQVPFVLKRDLSEAEYYRLKALEREWVGLLAERGSRREYPMGKVGCDILGYMGAINRDQYDAVIEEMDRLERFLVERQEGELQPLPEGFYSEDEVRLRLRNLEEKAYRLDDFVGRSGAEGRFEKELRGYYGQKVYSSDARGNYLRELPGGRDAVSGQRLLLSISAELQQYCEELLIMNESIREGQSKTWDRSVGHHVALPEPWIKGGAIVVMDPNNGELLALASHPRFDPNDFIATGDPAEEKARNARIRRWFELESHIASIWDGKEPLRRDALHGEDSLELSWDAYLSLLVPDEHPVHELLAETPTIGSAVAFLQDEERPEPEFGYQRLHIDLLRLLIDSEEFPSELLPYVGEQHLADYRAANRAYTSLESVVRALAFDLFHRHHFEEWREQYGKEYLREKRREEEAEGRYQRPYLDYFRRLEKKLFARFWKKERWDLLLTFVTGRDCSGGRPDLLPYRKNFMNWSQELSSGAHQGEEWYHHYHTLRDSLSHFDDHHALLYLRTMRSFDELESKLVGRYPGIRNDEGVQKLKHLASAFYPRYGFGYGRSHAFQQATVQGSLFKVVTGYQALIQRYEELRGEVASWELNPLTIMDQPRKIGKKWQMGSFMDGEAIPQLYHGGRLIRSLSRNIGETDLIIALERSSNPYFSILAGDYLNNPEDLNYAASLLGYGERTGIDLPGELKGNLPNDLQFNRSGLYSYAIGQHSLIVSPLQAAVMVSTLANGGLVLTPKIISLTAGREPVREPRDLLGRRDYRYQDLLAFADIDFPLFTEAEVRENSRLIEPVPTEVRREVPLPAPVRELLMQGMERVVDRSRQVAFGGIASLYRGHSYLAKQFRDDPTLLVGKSSTAEVREHVGLNRNFQSATYNHIWFGGATFAPPFKETPGNVAVVKDRYGRPELVIIAYLRFGGLGHDALPVVSAISKKWREINRQL